VSFAELKRPRRYLLLKRLSSRTTEDGLWNVWKQAQEAQPGTALSAGFPSLSALAEAGYTTIEDLDGADAAELKDNCGLSARDAQAVLTALAPLL
jgi:hypothetical protein